MKLPDECGGGSERSSHQVCTKKRKEGEETRSTNCMQFYLCHHKWNIICIHDKSMESLDEIVVRHNLTTDMLNCDLPESLIGIPDHTIVDDHNKKLVKVSSYNKFAELCREERENIADSKLIVYALPDLSIDDANHLGVSMGVLICEDVEYTIANRKMIDYKIQKNRSVVQKLTITDDLIIEAKDKVRPDLHDIEYYELNRRYSCSRYVTSLMRSGTDKEVHDALKACFRKVHSEIYGGSDGFDQWCNPDEISPERVLHTQERLVSLRNKFMQDYPDAVDPVEERRNVLAAQGQLTQKKQENELRRDLVSFTQSFVYECKQIKKRVGSD